MKRMIMPLLAGGLFALTNCSKSERASSAAGPSPQQTPPVAASLPVIDACTLLTSADIEPVQGEAVQMSKPSTPSSVGLVLAQCYFALPTQSNSVVLTVARSATADGGAEVKKSWEQTFGAEKKEGESEKKKKPPQKVDGIGEEAFWVGSDLMGALYVLKGESYIRISVGGPGDAGSKLDKSRRLAELVLARLEAGLEKSTRPKP